jgi:hypothetical protein
MLITIGLFMLLVPLVGLAMDGPSNVRYRQAARICLTGLTMAFLTVLLIALAA